MLVLKSFTAATTIPTSAMAHDVTSRHLRVRSVVSLKADIHQRGVHVRFCANSGH